MSKTRRKMLIGDIWQIGEHESWFSNLSKEGWHLRKMGMLFAYFEQGEPTDIRYRIDTSLNKKMSAEDKEMFRETGWKYVTNFGEFTIFSSPTEWDAPELYTDPVEQSYILKDLDKKVRIHTITAIILSIIGIVMFPLFWLFDTPSTLSIVQGAFSQEISFMMMYLFFVYTRLRANFSIRKLRKALSDRNVIHHSALWKTKRLVMVIVYVFFMGVVVLGAFMPWIQIIMEKTQTLPMESGDVPIVRLAELEQNPGLVREAFLDEGHLDQLNQYTSNWSLFAPLQYQTDERGIVPNQLWQEGGATYSPSIHTQVYKLRFPFIKEKLIDDLTQEYGLHIYEGDLIERESDVFDILIIRQADKFKEVFAAKGKGVMYVSYLGHAETEAILNVVEEKFAVLE